MHFKFQQAMVLRFLEGKKITKKVADREMDRHHLGYVQEAENKFDYFQDPYFGANQKTRRDLSPLDQFCELFLCCLSSENQTLVAKSFERALSFAIAKHQEMKKSHHAHRRDHAATALRWIPEPALLDLRRFVDASRIVEAISATNASAIATKPQERLILKLAMTFLMPSHHQIEEMHQSVTTSSTSTKLDQQQKPQVSAFDDLSLMTSRRLVLNERIENVARVAKTILQLCGKQEKPRAEDDDGRSTGATRPADVFASLLSSSDALKRGIPSSREELLARHGNVLCGVPMSLLLSLQSRFETSEGSTHRDEGLLTARLAMTLVLNVLRQERAFIAQVAASISAKTSQTLAALRLEHQKMVLAFWASFNAHVAPLLSENYSGALELAREIKAEVIGMFPPESEVSLDERKETSFEVNSTNESLRNELAKAREKIGIIS